MIITRLLSGLGNQLFQYAIGRQLSIQKGVELKLDISFFKNQNLRSFKLDAFNINAEIATDYEIDFFTKVPTKHFLPSRLYIHAEKLIPRTSRRCFKENHSWQYEPDVFCVSKNTYIDGYWQHYKYFENVNDLIYEELSIKKKENNSDHHFLKQIINDEHSVSIHIRRGDYITDKVAFELMGVLPLRYYYSAIDIIKSKISKPNFYIFSDDMNWVKSNLTLAENCYYVDGEKDYIDLDLMSKCKNNIIANSSFSWWAANLNKNLKKIVIAPSKWVTLEHINKNIDLVFPSWIKI